MSQKKRAMLIVNPKAGKTKKTKKIVDDVRSQIGSDYDVSVRYTSITKDAEAIAREESAGIDLIICCGGDGTLNEVVNGLQKGEHHIPVSFLPRGTTNDLARTLKIPVDLKKNLALIEEEPRQQDVGIFNGSSYFTYVAAFGSFTEVSYSTSQSMKNRFGYFAYILASVKHLFKIKPYRASVTADGENYEGEYVYGSISNSTSIGKVIKLDPKQVGLDDGKLELLLVRTPKNFIEFMRTLIRVIRRDFTSKYLIVKSVECVSIEFLEEVSFTVDGEYGGSYQSLSIGVKPRAYKIYSGLLK